MRTILRLTAEILFAVGSILIPFIVASAVVPKPSSASGTHLRSSLDDSPIWTSSPTKVDRSQQIIERMPDPFPVKFRAPRNILIYDSGSFAFNGDVMILKRVIPLAKRQICSDARGRRTACGTRSVTQLRTMIAGKYLECFREKLALKAYLVECRIGNKNIADDLIGLGAGYSLNDSRHN